MEALGLLALGQLCGVPLTRRMHARLVGTHRDRRTLLDKFVQRLLSLSGALAGPVLRVADADSASAKVSGPLLARHHPVLTRLKSNAVAYSPPPPPLTRRRARPRRYGVKVRLRDL